MAHKLLQQRATIDMTSGRSAYEAPENILSLISVFCQGRLLTNLSVQEAAQRDLDFDRTRLEQPGIPICYTYFARTITVYPIPNLNLEQGIAVLMLKQPAEIVDSVTELELPLEYHNNVLAYALQMAYELDENWQAAQAKNAQMASSMAELRGRQDEQPEEFYPHVTYTGDSVYQDCTGWYY